MRIEKFTLSYYEELVEMYRLFITEIYPSRKIGTNYFFHKVVMEWIKNNRDINIALDDKGKALGFTMCYEDNNGGTTSSVYNGEIIYVNKQSRKSKVAYKLFKITEKHAHSLGMQVVGSALIQGGMAEMMSKHFSIVPKFVIMEGTQDGI